LDSSRDWGFAGDYIKAMHLMLQQNIADDFVVSTNETHTIREFIEVAFNCLGIKILWDNSEKELIKDINIKEYGYYIDKNNQKKIVVKLNKEFVRPAEVDLLIGDCSKTKKVLGWEPAVKFQDLVKMMLTEDMENYGN